MNDTRKVNSNLYLLLERVWRNSRKRRAEEIELVTERKKGKKELFEERRKQKTRKISRKKKELWWEKREKKNYAKTEKKERSISFFFLCLYVILT